MTDFTTPTRAQLSAITRDERTVRAVEGLFNAVLELLDTVAVLDERKALTQEHATNYTVLPEESGTTFYATAADVEFTLPPTEEGLVYTFVFMVPSAGVGGQVSPNAADKIMGNGFTSLDNKAAINSGATDREADCITLCGNGTTGWTITSLMGTWAREV